MIIKLKLIYNRKQENYFITYQFKRKVDFQCTPCKSLIHLFWWDFHYWWHDQCWDDESLRKKKTKIMKWTCKYNNNAMFNKTNFKFTSTIKSIQPTVNVLDGEKFHYSIHFMLKCLIWWGRWGLSKLWVFQQLCHLRGIKLM